MRDNTQTERGQAYTLEGFIGAMVVLMAVLFALQSVVIAPTTGGAVDRTVQAQMQQETQDALVVASDANEDKDNLFEMVEDWYEDDDGLLDELNPTQQDPDGNDTYSPGEFSETALGDILYERFDESGQSYNVELRPEDDDEDDEYLVYQGSPSSSAVTASYTVTIVEDEDVDLVEVRVVVW